MSAEVKFESSPIDHSQAKTLDMWDLRLAQENKQHSSSVTPTIGASSPAAVGGSTSSAGSTKGFKPLKSGSADLGMGQLDLLSMALRSSPQTLKTVKFEIAKLVMAKSGNTAKPTEEEANAIIEILAKELNPQGANSVTPPDGRMTIESELQWAQNQKADPQVPAHEVTSVRRPNAPVNDTPQVVQDPELTTGVIENSDIGAPHARVYSDTSSTSTQPIRPKPQVLKHTNKAIIQSIRRHGGLRNHSSRTSAFSENSQGSFGTGSSVSKENRAE